MAADKGWQSKKEARAQLLLRLSELTNSAYSEMQERLCFHLDSFLSGQKGLWGAYRPLVSEASPSLSIQNNRHLSWAYPRMEGNFLEFYLEPKRWLKGALNIEEPDPLGSEKVTIQSLNGYLVPGLGFDQNGIRLGRGRGYFDRALAEFKGIKVGVAFSVQVVEELPHEEFDIPMDVLVTDQGIVFNSLEGDRKDD